MRLTVGAATLPRNFQKVFMCVSPTGACRLLLPSPPWDRWLQVTAKSLAGPRVLVAFQVVAALTGGLRGRTGMGGSASCSGSPGLPVAEPLVSLIACRPWNLNFQHLPQSSLNESCNASTGLLPPRPADHGDHGLGGSSRRHGGPCCLTSYPVIREDLDVVSVRFWPVDRVWVQVRPTTPSVMRLYMDTGMDSGGSLTVSLRANKVGTLTREGLASWLSLGSAPPSLRGAAWVFLC